MYIVQNKIYTYNDESLRIVCVLECPNEEISESRNVLSENLSNQSLLINHLYLTILCHINKIK